MYQRLLTVGLMLSIAAIALLVPNFFSSGTPLSACLNMTSIGAAVFGAIMITAAVIVPVTRGKKLSELDLIDPHHLRKTEANSFTYFVDHPTLPDGSPDHKHFRFSFECSGEELQVIIPVDRVSLSVDANAIASVHFCFGANLEQKCSNFSKFIRRREWWLNAANSKETGFDFALITMSPKELQEESILRSAVKYC